VKILQKVLGGLLFFDCTLWSKRYAVAVAIMSNFNGFSTFVLLDHTMD